MSDWLHTLPVILMALIVFGFTYLLAAVIYVVVMILAIGERARSFKAVSPGMLPPLGIIFGLFVGFTAAQVWSDADRANAAVDREASALRSVVILAAAFPGEPETRLRSLISSYIAEAAAQEWPMMAHRKITLQVAPHALAEALQLTLALLPNGPGQQIAQREITVAIEARWIHVASASGSANRKSIGSSGRACTCRQLQRCWRSPWSTATIGSPPRSRWGSLRPG